MQADTEYHTQFRIFGDPAKPYYEAYRPEDYEQGYNNVAAVLSPLERMLSEIETEYYDWRFRAHDHYPIIGFNKWVTRQ